MHWAHPTLSLSPRVFSLLPPRITRLLLMLRPLDARKAEQALAIALPLAAKLPGPDAHRVEIDAFIEQWDDVKVSNPPYFEFHR